MSIPSELKYTKEHEWLRVEGDTVVVGITHHAQEQLGDVVFVDLPAVGTKLKQGATFGTVESVKAVSELYSPVAGEVVKVNAELVGKPETINKDPHGAAWMIEIRIADPSSTSSLLDAAAYQALVDSEAK